ncbi:hypothetical protein ABH917_003741 [Thermobifida halotolerans]|uniref:DNA/RNA non-specific endonuclease n=1 Tax=Thermobifida halotolerans TaxID=483545 RepID=UPI0035177ADC
MKGDGSDIGQAGADIKAAWSGLEGNYIAPESEELLAAVNPVADAGDEMETNIRTVGQALIDFAADIRPILSRWKALKADAVELSEKIRGDDDWREDEDTVEEHNQLNDDLLAAQNDYMAAERECANKITGLFGGTRFIAAATDGSTVADDGEQVYGFTEAPEGVETPWASPQEYDAPWWEDAWNGVADFGVGIAQDLAGMVGLYSETGGWGAGSWSEWGSNLGEYWGGTLEGLGSLVGLYGENGWGVGSFGEWWGNFSSGWTEFAHAIVPWREWGDRPGYVITQSVLNIGSMFLGGSGVVKALAQGARRAGPDAGDLDAPNADAPTMSRVDASDLSGGLDSGRLRADLGDAVDGLDIDTSRLGALDDALANADAFADADSSPSPTGGGGSPTGGNGGPTITPTSHGGADRPTGTGDAPSTTTADVPAPARGGDSTPATDTGDTDVASPGTDTPATVHADAPGADRPGSADRTGDRDAADADAAADLPTTEWIENQVNQFRSDLDLAEVDGGIANRLAEDRQPALVHAGAPEVRMEAGGHDSGGSPDLSPSAHHSGPDGPGGGGGSGGPGGRLDQPSSGRGDTSSPSLSNGDSDSGFPGGGSDTHTPGQHRGDLDGNGGDSGNGGDGQGSSRSGGPSTRSVDVNAERPDLVPGARELFAEGVKLDPDTTYRVTDSEGNYRGEYTTDHTGEIVQIRTNGGRVGHGWNYELNNPRPNMKYIVDDRYTFQTDQYSRTVSMEGELEVDKKSEKARRNGNSQDKVMEFGYNDYSGNSLYQNGPWNAGHLVGTKFKGPGELINLVPQLKFTNQHQRGPNNPNVNFRDMEREWQRLIEREGKTVEVKVECIYPEDGSIRTPTVIRVHHWIDGQPQRTIDYGNVPFRNGNQGSAWSETIEHW